MDELSLVSRQIPGIVSIDNFQELKEALEQHLEFYKSISYSEDGVKVAKKDKTALNKLKKAIDDKRKEIKKNYMQPYMEVEAQAKELIALIDEPLALISEYIAQEAELEKTARRQEIAKYYSSHSDVLGDFAEKIFDNPAFYDKKWENKSTSVKAYQSSVAEKIQKVATDISAIQATGGKHTAALLERYFETLSVDQLSEYKSSLESADSAACIEAPIAEEDCVIGYKVLRISGNRLQMEQLMEYMELLGVEVDELEDGMPGDMEELSLPSFDSFVAFDIETTGTFGAAHGDTSAEITEIGAVKVIDGVITDRFSMLANPGRKIVPRIARLTHITDDMVKDQPPICEVIKAFKEFVGDSVLVGHNIKNCDIPHIIRAATRSGIAFDNYFFDTYRYAKTLKSAMGWENVKLEYLSEQFGILQSDAHRAWCDAEANVGVYFKLKDLSLNK